MEDFEGNNHCILRGVLAEAPTLSHESRGERFYRFSLHVRRLSGATDTVHVIAKQSLLEELEPETASKICVCGELRSFNNKSGAGPRLVISVYAKEIHFDDEEDLNEVTLHGTICKEPNLRTTPMGREICDIMLAVNRKYGRSDYLPCIIWGSSAQRAAGWAVGDRITIDGRIQSRIYTKTINGIAEEKTAFEVSAVRSERDT